MPIPTALRCESCGAGADVVLVDDSAWCYNCDEAARRLGYDDLLIVRHIGADQ